MEQVATSRDGVRIAYEPVGAGDGEPMLLIMGLGMQMISWPDGFCAELVARGFAPARFDNRDVGRSSHFPEGGTPSLLGILTRPRSVAAYRLADMATDAVSVLAALGWDSAHVVGVSLGGMIAQTLAMRYPHRVRSLVSMMSTPSVRIGRPTLAALAALASPRLDDREAAGQRMVDVFRVIGGPYYPPDEQWLRDTGRRAYDRCFDPAGVRRQLAAAHAAGDRRPGLAAVRAPTLVLHGLSDPLVRPSGGRATAAAVPGARLVTYPRIGHSLPEGLWATIADEIARTAAVAR